MNPSIQLKQTTSLFLVAFGLACFGFSQALQAVSPPPDGGYPNFTTAEGDNALKALTTGEGNTAVGTFSLFRVSTGNFNTAVGAGSLDLNQADSNTATGAAALLFNTTGTENTASGTAALEFNSTGGANTATGAFALLSNTTGSDNTAVGRNALFNTTTGNDNVALGRGAGANQTTGSSNIFIGDIGGAGISNVIAIGNSPVSGTSYDKFYAGAVYGIITDSTTTLPVIIDNFGQLGTAPSAARFKKQIKPMDKMSEAILALKPVSFEYRSDTKGTPQFGLIAEEVAKVDPDLVVRDRKGEIYSVRYDAVNAMLLNEFLKEHKTVEELKSIVAEQRKGMEQMATQLKEQAAQIQKVSAQLAVSKAAPQTVLNDR